VTARILVVDDLLANVKLLQARLTAEYFDVRTALDGRQAIDIARHERVDLVLLDVMMPGMSGFEVCRALKSDPETAHVPVVMVTALDEVEDRVRGLECGADDFLTKPVSEIALITRVKSLVRLKSIADELDLRAATLRSIGVDPSEIFAVDIAVRGRVLVVDDRRDSVAKIEAALAADFDLTLEPDPAAALAKAEAGGYDLLLVSLSLSQADGLRLCSQIRAVEKVRHLPVLLGTDPDETTGLLTALELGVNDYIIRPIDVNELGARVRTQLRRKIYADRLRGMVSSAMELALTDPLTGLHNRRYLDSHLRSLAARAAASGKPVALLIFDIGHFKAINDRWGHEAGDDVLVAFAERLKLGLRGIDLAARLGGEEFVVVMPETDGAYAAIIAERLRRDVETKPFATRSGQALSVTVSIGVAELRGASDSVDALLRRADEALYSAKRDGRNRVVAAAAARPARPPPGGF
jgi:two-component system, cell cycle response regulator